MIITRTPLRISIGGGGTDLPSYYRKFGGFVISGAINKHIYISLNRSFFDGFFLKYSELEHAKHYDDIRHPLIREVLRLQETPTGIEIVSTVNTYSKLKAMVEAGAVEWDVAQMDSSAAATNAAQGLLEKLDYGVIDKTDLIAGVPHESYIPCDVAAAVMSWNTPPVLCNCCWRP